MEQDMNNAANAAQIDYWNAVAGETWSQFHEQLDRQIEPLGLEALRVLDPNAGERVLDIGCGCGQTTVALAQRVGPEGAVVGLDISRPMLKIARKRSLPDGACRPDFREADAQSDDLGAAAFDAAFSRFGVMFFSDPIVAFANVRSALKPNGRISFVCWRPFQENAWMRIPMEAAQPFLDPTPAMDPLAPGPFAFADPDRVRSILGSAGFEKVTVDAFDAEIGGASIEQTVALTFKVGPLGAALRENPDRVPTIADVVRTAVARFDTPAGVKMPAAAWIVRAHA
jgi:SAM-dependent methyltransferase